MSDKKRKSYLTIRFEGPEVRPGRMRLDDFIQAAREFSACAKRVILALQNTPSTTEGRRPKDVTESLSLDLVAFTEGSLAAVAHLERSQDQMQIDDMDMGERAYQLLLEGLEAVGADGDTLPEGFDLGVLLKIRDMGRLFNKGVTRIDFQLNHRRNPVKATFDPSRHNRVRQRIERPEAQKVTLQGRLLMVDFKETGRQIRIHPSIGQPVICQFAEDLNAEVEECIRGFVRVTGKMVYHESGAPKWLELTDIERVEAPSDAMSVQEEGWTYDFWESLTAEEYARRQGVTPVADTAILYGEFAPDAWEGFDEALESWRTI